ncbi:hypothetical protein LOK49_LG04G02544 [Camellia lanceoleosa]|uniref:Uncharacterized protein n=1 Tax=Camellia lanceoleosa TaxID=1840588 RepID=A0ACC0I3S4_9ERIC|nr:hypothetical protein LOK49_LG04G02544 [Camellia lanceoleosa]
MILVKGLSFLFQRIGCLFLAEITTVVFLDEVTLANMMVNSGGADSSASEGTSGHKASCSGNPSLIREFFPRGCAATGCSCAFRRADRGAPSGEFKRKKERSRGRPKHVLSSRSGRTRLQRIHHRPKV